MRQMMLELERRIFPKCRISSNILKHYAKLLKDFNDLKSELDSDFHKGIPDDLFELYGNIYYKN